MRANVSFQDMRGTPLDASPNCHPHFLCRMSPSEIAKCLLLSPFSGSPPLLFEGHFELALPSPRELRDCDWGHGRCFRRDAPGHHSILQCPLVFEDTSSKQLKLKCSPWGSATQEQTILHSCELGQQHRSPSTISPSVHRLPWQHCPPQNGSGCIIFSTTLLRIDVKPSFNVRTCRNAHSGRNGGICLSTEILVDVRYCDLGRDHAVPQCLLCFSPQVSSERHWLISSKYEGSTMQLLQFLQE